MRTFAKRLMIFLMRGYRASKMRDCADAGQCLCKYCQKEDCSEKHVLMEIEHTERILNYVNSQPIGENDG